MRKLILFLFKETNFVLILTFIITFLGLFPSFYNNFAVAPKNATYTFGHNYLPDYYQYLSWMKDGSENKFLITSRYSVEQFPRKPVYLFYPAIGFLTSKLGLANFYGYTLFRIIFSLFKIFTIYFLISQVFRKSIERKIAFATAVFLPSFYYLFPFRIIRPDISSLDILQRTFFLPHNLLTTICAILIVVLMQKWLSTTNTIKGIKILASASLLSIIASITNPAILSFFYLFLGVGTGLTFLLNPSLRKKLFIGSIIVIGAGLPLIFYYQKLFSTTLPFSWLYNQQKVVYLNVGYWQYFLSCGPVILLFLWGIPTFLKRKGLVENFIVSWAIIPFLFVPFMGRALPVSQERLFELSHFIPLSILSVAGFYFLIDHLVKVNNAKAIIKKISLAFFIIFSSFYLYHSFKDQLLAYSKPYFNIYVPNSVLEVFNWLDKNTPDESTVASSFYTSSMLPAFSHNKVLLGHEFVTYKVSERKLETQIIFGQNSPPEEIIKILKERNINYLLFTAETESIFNTNLTKLNNLSVVYQNKENLIMKVQN